MKKLTGILLCLLLAGTALGQDITGQWNGLLSVQGIQLRLVFHISKTDQGYSSTMDSPDQGAKGIAVTSTSFVNSHLNLKITMAGIEYDGELKDDVIVGTFKQGGLSIPLDLKKEEIEKPEMKRPQEPAKPYPYYSEDVKIVNHSAQLELAGTLTLPSKEGVFPAAILISGSGPQNRDEELLGHKPFLIISDYLTRNGIAVLRYDDRGTAGSTGDFSQASSMDLATDAEAVVAYLKTRKEIDPKKIGLIGHSEGGVIAPIIAARSKDLAFIVLLAGTGIPGDQLLLLQQKLIGTASGATEEELKKAAEINKGAFELILNATDSEKLNSDLTAYLTNIVAEDPESLPDNGMSTEDMIQMQVKQLAGPWMQFFLKHDPAPTLKKVRCPVLALNGEKDLQVPPKENLSAIEQALKKGRNKSVTIKEFPGLNHLFQECTTGSPDEYAKIEQTFSPDALKFMTEWILGII